MYSDMVATTQRIPQDFEFKKFVQRNNSKGYSPKFYVVTRSKYLHEFKDDDDYRKDPTPELSLYLPHCTVGGISGEKFNIKGKDTSKGKVGSTLAMRYVFSKFSLPCYYTLGLKPCLGRFAPCAL